MSEAPTWLENNPGVLRLDAYATASLLRIAIRRGEADLADSAAIRLHRLCGPRVWRHLLFSAFEDVSVGSLDALLETTGIALGGVAGRSVEGIEPHLGALARQLAEAPKDRSAICLMSAAWSHPAFEDARRVIDKASPAERLDLVAEADVSLTVRAIAAWRASGMRWRASAQGDLTDLMAVFAQLGVPADLILAARQGANLTHKPIVVMAPLVWLAACKDSNPAIVACPLSERATMSGVPLCAFDWNTVIGKTAIRRLARQSQAVRDALRAFAPENRAQLVASSAAFYADGAPVSRRLDWEGSVALEVMGIEADMLRAGAALPGVQPILAAFRDNLGDLNLIRARLFCRR
jgi:hypothetical protein